MYNMSPERFRQLGKQQNGIAAAEGYIQDLAKQVSDREKYIAAVKKTQWKANNDAGESSGWRKSPTKKQTVKNLSPDGENPGYNRENPATNVEEIKNVNPADVDSTTAGQKIRKGVNEYGTHIVAVSASLETIIKCKESNTDLAWCQAELMVMNGAAATADLAIQMLSEGAVVHLSILGGGIAVFKGASDTYKILYNFQDWAGAEWERYQTEKNREKWTRVNLESGSLDDRVSALKQKIINTLEPVAKEIRTGCDQLERSPIRQSLSDGENQVVFTIELPEILEENTPTKEELESFKRL